MSIKNKHHNKPPYPDDGKHAAQAAKRLLDESFASALSLEALTSGLGLGPRTLRDLFKRNFGVSPSQYRMSLRINEAKRLLDQGIPVKQIVADTGFFDQSHLSRHFKRITGMTPVEYAAQLDGQSAGEI